MRFPEITTSRTSLVLSAPSAWSFSSTVSIVARANNSRTSGASSNDKMKRP